MLDEALGWVVVGFENKYKGRLISLYSLYSVDAPLSDVVSRFSQSAVCVGLLGAGGVRTAEKEKQKPSPLARHTSTL